MSEDIFQLYIEAKDSNDIVKMKSVYETNCYNCKIVLQYAKMLFKRKKFDEAKKVLSKYLEKYEDMFIRFELGKTEFVLGNTLVAKNHFEYILKTKKDNYVLLELGRVEYSLGNVERAKSILKSLLSVPTSKYRALFELGKIELNEENTKGAQKYFEEILTICPDVYAMMELGRIEAERGNFVKAKKYFYEILRTKNDCYVYVELGKIEAEEKHFETAKNLFKKAFGTPNEIYAKIELSKMELNRGRTRNARKYLDSIPEDEKTGLAYLGLGKIEAEEGNYEKAKEIFLKLVNTQAKHMAEYEMAKLELDNGNLAEARKYLECLKVEGYSPSVALLFGNLEIADNRFDEAEKHLYYVLEHEHLYLNYCANFFLAIIRFKKGNLEESKELFITAKKCGHKLTIYSLRYLLLICIKQNDLNEAFKYFMELRHLKAGTDDKAELFLMKRLNIFFEHTKPFKDKYGNDQIIDYDEYVAIEHIIDRHENEFAQDINIYELFHTIKKYLVEEYRQYELMFNDFYDIPYQSLGIDKEGHIRVVTLPCSKQIMSMYPLYRNNEFEEELNDAGKTENILSLKKDN